MADTSPLPTEVSSNDIVQPADYRFGGVRGGSAGRPDPIRAPPAPQCRRAKSADPPRRDRWPSCSWPPSVVDFGTTIFAEYRLARTVRAAARAELGSRRWRSSGFPFIPQAMRQHYSEVEIKANDVEHPLVGKASLEATMHSIDLTDSSWLIGPDAKLPGRQAGKPHHHRLRAPGPVHGDQGPDGRSPLQGYQRRHRRHHRIRDLRQPRPGVHRHPEVGGLRQARQRFGGPVDDRRGHDDTGVHPDRCAHRAGHRRPGGARRQEAGRARRVPLQPCPTRSCRSGWRRPARAPAVPT